MSLVQFLGEKHSVEAAISPCLTHPLIFWDKLGGFKVLLRSLFANGSCHKKSANAVLAREVPGPSMSALHQGDIKSGEGCTPPALSGIPLQGFPSGADSETCLWPSENNSWSMVKRLSLMLHSSTLTLLLLTDYIEWYKMFRLETRWTNCWSQRAVWNLWSMQLIIVPWLDTLGKKNTKSIHGPFLVARHSWWCSLVVCGMSWMLAGESTGHHKNTIVLTTIN